MPSEEEAPVARKAKPWPKDHSCRGHPRAQAMRLSLPCCSCCDGDPGAAQTATHQQMWGERVKRIEAFRKQPPLNMALDVEAEVDINRNLAGFALFAYEQGLTHGLRGLEDARTDKQVGAPAGSGGATGLVSKGAVPAIRFADRAR
jgi:hypothetical protein